MGTEADTGRALRTPKRQVAGWEQESRDAQFVLPEVLRVPPIFDHGQPGEIIQFFGGADQLRNAVNQLQSLLYAA